MDEPSDGLDPILRKSLWRMIDRYSGTIFFTTHQWEEVEGIADKIVFIQKGRLISKALSFQKHKQNLPFIGKIILHKDEQINDDHLNIKKIEEDQYIYFKNESQKESILQALLKQKNIMSYTLSSINLLDIYL